jgi:hypothetical protein
MFAAEPVGEPLRLPTGRSTGVHCAEDGWCVPAGLGSALAVVSRRLHHMSSTRIMMMVARHGTHPEHTTTIGPHGVVQAKRGVFG